MSNHCNVTVGGTDDFINLTFHNLFQVKRWTVVCSRHFTPNCFENDSSSSLPGEVRRKLIQGSVPTLFSWNGYGTQTPNRKPPACRHPLTLISPQWVNLEKIFSIIKLNFKICFAGIRQLMMQLRWIKLRIQSWWKTCRALQAVKQWTSMIILMGEFYLIVL